MRLLYVFPFMLAAAACGPPAAERSDDPGQRSADVERSPRTLTTLENEATVAIAVDDTHAYVTTSGNGGGSIVKVPLGGGGHQVIATMNPMPFTIAIDDTSIYFTVRETGRVHRVGKDGGAVSVVAEPHERSNGAEAIAIDATHVYWSAVGGIFRAPKGGSSSPAERLTEENEGADAIAVEGDDVYWIARGTADTANGALYKVAKTGGERTELGTGDIFRSTWGFSIAAKNGSIYVPDTGGGRVYRVDGKSGALTLVAEGLDHPVAIAADARRVYWSTGGVQGATSEYRKLYAAPLEGGAAGPLEILVSTRQANINAIASNGRGVFFTDYTSTGSVFAAR
jgi:hypothetical protein